MTFYTASLGVLKLSGLSEVFSSCTSCLKKYCQAKRWQRMVKTVLTIEYQYCKNISLTAMGLTGQNKQTQKQFCQVAFVCTGQNLQGYERDGHEIYP